MSPRLTLGALILLACCMSTGAVMTDICEGQQTTLNCGSSVINVVSANYGRTDSVTCISGRPANQISKTDCINPKTFPLVASICNGKTSCSLDASNSVFSDPCFGTYKYLNVNYVCIPPKTTDICEGQQATLNCGSSVINVVSANYGRTDSVTCISGRPANQISKTDCINPKTFPLVASICNGKTSCSLDASNSVFSDPCFGTYKYLNVNYVCIPPKTTDICEGQQATLNCGSSVINVVSANYGRTDSVTCISGRPANQISKTDCINPNTFPLVASICNGKTSCSLDASNSVFSDPCFGTYKYLNVNYVCIPPKTTDICEGQQATLNCGSSEINVVSANYGRTDSVTCISGRPANQISKTDCINPKTFPLVASICDKKKSCSLVASNSVFSDPCYGTYKYLDVTYTCIPPMSIVG
ncbi:rhamnose-binding lectin-like [Osmerus eperlanus]|uniref:rhamnose-binding lectin-like n=1 Tax=Osmerus eperlanus TaxID=29151 RepID=UPI002E0EF1C9